MSRDNFVHYCDACGEYYHENDMRDSIFGYLCEGCYQMGIDELQDEHKG